MVKGVTQPCPLCGKRFKNIKGHQHQSHRVDREQEVEQAPQVPKPTCSCAACRSGRIPGMVMRSSLGAMPDKIDYTRAYMEHECENPNCPHRANWKTFIPQETKTVTVNGVAFRVVAEEENRVPGVVYEYYMYSLRENRDLARPRQPEDLAVMGNARQLAGSGFVRWDTGLGETVKQEGTTS